MGNTSSVEEFERKAPPQQGNFPPQSPQGFVADQEPTRKLESFQLDKRYENHVGLPVAVDGYGGGILRFYGRHKLPPHILCGIAMHVPAVEIATGSQPGIVYLNHKNPTAILCDPQKVTLITDDPFLDNNNITRWSDEQAQSMGFRPQSNSPPQRQPTINPYAQNVPVQRQSAYARPDQQPQYRDISPQKSVREPEQRESMQYQQAPLPDSYNDDFNALGSTSTTSPLPLDPQAAAKEAARRRQIAVENQARDQERLKEEEAARRRSAVEQQAYERKQAAEAAIRAAAEAQERALELAQLNAENAQRRRTEIQIARQEQERNALLEEAERLREQQQKREADRKLREDRAAQKRDELARIEAERQALEEEKQRKIEQARETQRIQRETALALKKQQEEDERKNLEEANNKRLQDAQRRREEAIARGESAAAAAQAMKEAEEEQRRLIADGKARRAAEEMERVTEAEERKRVAALQQAERERIAEDAKQRRLRAEKDRIAEAAAEDSKTVTNVKFAERPPIEGDNSWWEGEEQERALQKAARMSEALSKSGGARKATLFDLNLMQTPMEPPKALTQAEFNLLPKAEKKTAFEIVKRARPSMVAREAEEEDAHEECTFLGDCKCPNCR